MLSDGQQPSFNESPLTLTIGVLDSYLDFPPRYYMKAFLKSVSRYWLIFVMYILIFLLFLVSLLQKDVIKI